MTPTFLQMPESLAVREINKISLCADNCMGIDADGNIIQKPSIQFIAYITSEVNMQLTSDILSLNPEQSSIMLTLGSNALLGKVPAFDYPRYFGYRGTSPVTIPISCYLKLGSDSKEQGEQAYINDIVNPLLDLFSLALPYRDKESILGIKNEEVEKANQSGGTISKGIASIVDYFTAKGLDKYLGQIYMLNVPSPMLPDAGIDSRISLAIGANNTIRVGEVIIKSISMSFPKLILGEGYPERVNLVITLETLRNVTQDSMRQILIKPKTSNDQ